MSGPVASRFDGEPKALRKTARRAMAVHGAAGAVVVVIAPDGACHLGCSHSMEFLGKVLEKALNDWKAAQLDAQRNAREAAAVAPVVVEAKHLPKLAMLRALAGGRKGPGDAA